MKTVRHQQASQLLHNKFVVVLGDSIQRSVYKDLVVILQSDKYLSLKQLKCKGEMNFEQDTLVEGGCRNRMTNGTDYREVRQYQSDHHLLRFYFVTRIFSRYMESILMDFERGPKPDVVIVNSCVWDISRYNSSWLKDYQENLHLFFGELNRVLPEETLVIWNVTMPLGERIKGGFLVPEIAHKAPQLRYDVIEANFFSGTLADAYNKDVLDLHFHFRFSLQHRTKDGVHWNAIAHRRITYLILQHIAHAWGVTLPNTVNTVESGDHSFSLQALKPAEFPPTPIKYTRDGDEFFSDSMTGSFLTCDDKYSYGQKSADDYRSNFFLPLTFRHQNMRSPSRRGFHWSSHKYDIETSERQYVMRSRFMRHHYAPYTRHRPNRYGHRGN